MSCKDGRGGSEAPMILPAAFTMRCSEGSWNVSNASLIILSVSLRSLLLLCKSEPQANLPLADETPLTFNEMK